MNIYLTMKLLLLLLIVTSMMVALENNSKMITLCDAAPTKQPTNNNEESDYYSTYIRRSNHKERYELEKEYKQEEEQQWKVQTSCPSCPMCDRSNTSFADSLRYCNRFTSSIRQYWKSVESLHLSTREIQTNELPFTKNVAIRKQALQHIRELLETQLVGQPHVIEPLVQLMRHKMFSPNEPLVIHLAGDNGVGKTFTARLISLALSLHCTSHISFSSHLPSLLLEGIRRIPQSALSFLTSSRQEQHHSLYDHSRNDYELQYLQERCEAGDALLTIAGSGFDKMPLREARARIVDRVISHMEQHPHGIVLIDDLTVMNPELVSALAPLFGRDSHFPEQFAPERYSWYDRTDHNNNDDEQYYEEEEEEQYSENKELCLQQKETEEEEEEEENYIYKRVTNNSNTMSTLWSSLLSAAKMENTSGRSRSKQKQKQKQKQKHYNQFPHYRKQHTLPPSLSQLTVFITTDFGQQGRTVNKTIDEIHQLVRNEFKDVYGKLLPAHVRTFVYAPFQFETALEMIISAVRYLPCKFYRTSTLLYSADIEYAAAHFLVQRHRTIWEGSENGHALRRIVEDELIAQLMEFWEKDEEERIHNNYNENVKDRDIVMRANNNPHSKLSSWEEEEEEEYLEYLKYESDKLRKQKEEINLHKPIALFTPWHAHFVLDEHAAKVVLQLRPSKLQ